MNDTTTVRFYGNSSEDRALKIETDGAVVHVHAGLVNAVGNAVTRVDVTPDGEERGGDADGRVWRIVESGPGVVRVVRDPAPVDIRGRADGGGHWSLVFSTGEPTDLERALIGSQIAGGAINGSFGQLTNQVAPEGLVIDLERKCGCSAAAVAIIKVDTGDEVASACTSCGGWR